MVLKECPYKSPYTLPDGPVTALVKGIHAFPCWDLGIESYQVQSSGMGEEAKVRVGPQQNAPLIG